MSKRAPTSRRVEHGHDVEAKHGQNRTAWVGHPYEAQQTQRFAAVTGPRIVEPEHSPARKRSGPGPPPHPARGSRFCFDSELPPSRPWIPAPHVVALGLGPERFALAVARRTASGVEIVRAAEHRLDALMGRVTDACGAFDVRSVYVCGEDYGRLPALVIGNAALRARVTYADRSTRAVSPVLASDLMIDAAEIAATVAASLPVSKRGAVRRRVLAF